MMPTTRTVSVAGAVLLLASACGQDLDLGPITGRDGFTLPPPGASSSAGGACAVEVATAVPLPSRCPNENRALAEAGLPDHNVFSEDCLVTADGQVIKQDRGLAACPMGVYWKFDLSPWRRDGAPMPTNSDFPTAEVFEGAIAVFRTDQPRTPLPASTEWAATSEWRASFLAEGWQAVPHNVQVLPDRRALFIRFDPRPSTGQRFMVFLNVPQLTPDAVDLPAPGLQLALQMLEILPGTAPAIE
jgi:hypothetical protein